MNIKHFFVGLATFALLLPACKEKEEDLGAPRLKVDVSELSFNQGEDSGTVQVTATRDWFISSKPDWVALSVEEGKGSTKPQSVTISVNANTGNDRVGEVLFSIGYVKSAVVINQKGSKGEIKMGSGTLEDPYTVVGVIAYVQTLGKDVNSENRVYIKGKVSRLGDQTFKTSGTYGNATFYISDDGNAADEFYCYRIKYLGNKTYSSGDDVAVGDDVIICGNVVNYKGNTPETVQNTAYLYSLNGKSDEVPEQTEITACTIAEFIQKADPNTYYRLTGKVSSFQTGTATGGRQWLQFNLDDGTATILVYGFKDGQYDKWANVIKDGGTAVLTGTYEYYASKQQHEVMNATVESFTEGSVNTVTGTVAQTIAANVGDNVVVESCQVVAKSEQGIVVSDATGNVYLYFDTKNGEAVPGVNIGDMVKVEAVLDIYGGIPEFKKAGVTVINAGGQVSYPDPKDITSEVTTYSATTTEFIQMTGTLTISGNYYNIEFDGVDTGSKQGSISAPLSSLGVSSYNGKKVTVTGYFTGLTSGGKFISIVATSIGPADPNAKYCSVSPAKVNVKADATSASFQISTNADWTAVSDNQEFTVSPASGSGDAAVTVSFSANQTDAPRVANIKVSCPAANYEATVTVTQAKPSSGESVVIAADFTKEDTNLPQGSANGVQDGTYTINGYTLTLHAADKYYQGKVSQTDVYYLLIGKANSYIEFPAIEGKSLVKIEFLTGSGASENVIPDIAKADGTRLNINNDKLKKGTSYTWELTGEPGAAYRFLITNAYNAQFQTLTLTYE